MNAAAMLAMIGRTCVLPGAWVLLLALTLAPGFAPAEELPSHLGVQPDAFVALEYRNGMLNFSGCTNEDTICASPRRILPDGSRAAFAIPSGTVLVVTDIKWTSYGGSEGDTAQIYASNIGYSSVARFDDNKTASYNEHLTSGIVVSFVPTLIFVHHLEAKLSYLVVRGYLAASGRPVVIK